MKRHVDVLAFIVGYDFYQECATEHLALEAFGINLLEIKSIDFKIFKVCGSKQGME